ncbi:MAG: type II CAAX endopeptidase family protein [Planctomycetota bacterium]
MTPNQPSDCGGDAHAEQLVQKSENPATVESRAAGGGDNKTTAPHSLFATVESRAAGGGDNSSARIPSEPVEVTPDQYRENQYFENLTGFEKWILRNLAPLLVICGGLAAELISSVLAQLQRPPQDAIQEVSVSLRELPMVLTSESLTLSPVYLVVTALLLLGLFVWLAVAVTWVAFPEMRAWLTRAMQWRPRRPLPALRLIDLIACIAVFLGAIQITVVIVIPYLPTNMDNRRALDLLIQSVAMAAAIWAGVLLARRRAHGKHGANGVWPFWRLSPLNPRRSIWADIGLGVACYPLSLCLVGIALKLNQYLAQQFNLPIEENPIIGELLARPNHVALAIILTLATVGAAFFEELIFRGMFYNVLRRYFGGVVAAVLGAGLFAVAHRLPTQMLGLFVLGLIMIWLYERTGRLVASMTFHFVNNLIMLLIVLLRPD